MTACNFACAFAYSLLIRAARIAESVAGLADVQRGEIGLISRQEDNQSSQRTKCCVSQSNAIERSRVPPWRRKMSGDTELVGELYLSPKEAGVLITIYSSCFAQGRTAARRGCSLQAIAVSCLDKRLPVPSASLQQGRYIAILSELDSPLAGIIRSRPSKRSRTGSFPSRPTYSFVFTKSLFISVLPPS